MHICPHMEAGITAVDRYEKCLIFINQALVICDFCVI